MQPHHGAVVGAEGAHGVGQHLLEGEENLVVEAAHQIAVGPAGDKGGPRSSPKVAPGHSASPLPSIPQKKPAKNKKQRSSPLTKKCG